MAILVQSNKKPSVSFPSQTGSIVTFNSQYAGLPLKSHKIALTATQSGSGTPSPSNPRPITGYSAINISHSDADTSTPTVYTIQIGSTVYGGEYDARTGLLTVTHGFKLFDGTENWELNGPAGVYILLSTFTNNLDVNYCPETNIYQGTSRGQAPTTDYTANWNRQGTALQIRDSRGMTPTDFKQLLSQTNLQLKFVLATPTTIQLPPCPIDTLQGVNNIWADTGETTIVTIEPKIKEGN